MIFNWASYIALAHLIPFLIGMPGTAWVPSSATDLSNKEPPASETMNNVCQTTACNDTATEILNIMDSTVEPCDDFYKFSCGGFLNKEVPTMLNVLAISAGIDYLTEEQVKRVVNEPSLPEEPRSIKLVKDFYKSCMNEATIEQQGHKLFHEKMKDLGGWPVVKSHEWNETEFDWMESIHKARIAGFTFDHFLSLGIMADVKNNIQKVLYFGPPGFGMPRDSLVAGMNSSKVEAYYNFMVDVAMMLGAPENDTGAELIKSLEFEIALATITPPDSELRNFNVIYNKMTVAELSQKFPGVSWKNYINNILTPHVTVDDSENVIVSHPKFMTEFLKLMSSTPKRVLANYMMWRIAKDSVEYLNKNMVDRLSNYERETEGFTVNDNGRSARCVPVTKQSLIPVNALYVRKYVNSDTKNYVTEMVAEIQNQFRNILQTVDWMDNNTRQNALDKAFKMVSYVGYPDELLNDTILEEIYEKLELTDDYFDNSLRITRFDLNQEHSEFRKPVDKNNWKSHAQVTDANAIYNTLENSINVYAGNLQAVLFRHSLPKYMNYGSLGSIIGHEITHGFDDGGRQFDQNGNLRDWWTPYATEKYNTKAQCYIDQYSNYTVQEIGKKLDGFQTRNENIADNGGYKLAYLAYKDWSTKHGGEQSLPGLSNYTTLQMFWIRAAIAACSKVPPNILETIIADDEHSPGEFRILGSFRNLPEFAADFNCPVGSKMNPEAQCTLW